MIKSSMAWLAAGSLLFSMPGAAMAAPASEMLNPAGIASQEAVMKLPLCTKERTTQCRVAKNGTWMVIGALGLAAVAALALSGGGGKSASP
jgi:hypothetical protein